MALRAELLELSRVFGSRGRGGAILILIFLARSSGCALALALTGTGADVDATVCRNRNPVDGRVSRWLLLLTAKRRAIIPKLAVDGISPKRMYPLSPSPLSPPYITVLSLNHLKVL